MKSYIRAVVAVLAFVLPGLALAGVPTLTITADNQSGVYGSAITTLTVSYSGFVNGDTAASLTTQPTISTTATAASGAGSYQITAAGAVDSNYIIVYATGTYAITPAPLTVAVDNQNKIYGSALPTLTAFYIGFVNGDTAASLTTPPTISTTATAASHVAGNPYAITASGVVDPNYVISYVSGNLTVMPSPLTITADNQTKVYGSALPTLTASYTGFVNGDTSANLTTSAPIFTPANSASHVAGNPYVIIPSGAVDPDYVISYVSGSLTVTPAPLTITADNQTKVYGSALPTLTVSYTGFVNGDTSSSLTAFPTISTTVSSASHVAGSPYTITASGAVDPDYVISYVSGSLSVTPSPLTITANDQTKFYGSALPILTASYSGLVNGDTSASLSTPPAFSSTATNASSVGVYPITPSGAVDADYVISYANGSLTVNSAPLTITADNQTRAFGQPDPTFTVTYTGLVNGDFSGSLTTPPTVVGNDTVSSPAGTYTLTPSGAVDSNYVISYANGTLTITLATQTISFTSTPPSEIAGSTIPYGVSATASSGLTVTFTIDPASTPGTCSIAGNTVSFGAAGTCIVDADQAGDTSFGAAPTVQQTIVVAAVSLPPSAPVQVPLSGWALLLLSGLMIGIAGRKAVRTASP